MFKVNNKDTRTMPLHTLLCSVSIVNFEHVIADWDSHSLIAIQICSSLNGWRMTSITLRNY